MSDIATMAYVQAGKDAAETGWDAIITFAGGRELRGRLELAPDDEVFGLRVYGRQHGGPELERLPSLSNTPWHVNLRHVESVRYARDVS